MLHAATIVTNRLALDPLCPSDAEEMFEVLGDERLHEFIGGRPRSQRELRQRYERLVLGGPGDGSETWLNWIVRLRGDAAAVGTLQATLSEPAHAQVAWVIGIPWQRRGFASEAVVGLVKWLDENGISAISANVHSRHEASQRVAAKAGMRPTDEIRNAEQVGRR